MNGKISTFLFRSSYLFLFWILLSGKMDLLHLVMGIFCAASVARLSFFFDRDLSSAFPLVQIPGVFLRAVVYLSWLMVRIILAAIHVAKLILNPRMPIVPGIITHKTILKDDLDKVIFAHSITLTPGTITADLVGDQLTVHRLDAASSEDIDSHITEKKIQKIFKRKYNS